MGAINFLQTHRHHQPEMTANRDNTEDALAKEGRPQQPPKTNFAALITFSSCFQELHEMWEVKQSHVKVFAILKIGDNE